MYIYMCICTYYVYNICMYVCIMELSFVYIAPRQSL